jgi:hypothetical protein
MQKGFPFLNREHPHSEPDLLLLAIVQRDGDMTQPDSIKMIRRANWRLGSWAATWARIAHSSLNVADLFRRSPAAISRGSTNEKTKGKRQNPKHARQKSR